MESGCHLHEREWMQKPPEFQAAFIIRGGWQQGKMVWKKKKGDLYDKCKSEDACLFKKAAKDGDFVFAA